MVAIYFIQGAFARLWFGSDLESKIWSNRGLQTAYMILLFLSIYIVFPLEWFNVVLALIQTLWLQFQFWSRGHGAPADIGRDKKPSADTIRRYNERWYHIPCDWLFDKVFKHPEAKYGFIYDFIYMGMRYTCPMLVLALFRYGFSKLGLCEAEWRYILIGLSVAPIYSFCQTLQEYEPWVFDENKWYWRRGWSLAEILSGGVVYSCCYLLER